VNEEQSSDMATIGLGSVQTWDCDMMGHMNVQHYVARATESLATLAIAMGIGPRVLNERGLQLRPVDHHIRFVAELRPGTPFTMFGGFLGHADRALDLYQEMRHTVSGKVAATFRTKAAFVDAVTRMRLPLPTDLPLRPEGVTTVVPPSGAPRGVALDVPRPVPTREEADRLGLLLTQQSTVTTAECDNHGFMQIRSFMGRVSDAIPNLLAMTQRQDRSADGKVGGAALEYRFVYHSLPREGDVLALRSGIKAMGAKTFTWVHWLLDVETGRAVATSEAVAVSFDLVARKALEIDAGTRRAMEAFIVPGLSV
jgi:acyl-CoA thioester hydrolase